MRIFVSGATGVIGRRVVPRLVEAGHAVTAVVRSPQMRAAFERSGAKAVAVDLFARDALRTAVLGHDVVINLATHMPSSSLRMLLPGAFSENDRLRRLGAANLVDAALVARARRFIQESFAPVYPDCGDAWIDEHTPIAPARYNRSVADAEGAALHFLERGGTAIALRFAAFYGPDSRFLHDLIGMVRHGFLPLLGHPRSFISSVSHDDAARAVVAALDLDSGFYNVSDDQPLRHREFADALAAALGVEPPRLPPAWLTPIAGSIGKTLARSLRISSAKLRGYGWAPQHRSVRDGFRETMREIEQLRSRLDYARASSRGRAHGRPAR